nr:hypothetical protein [Frankia sp. Cr2]
MNEVYVLGGHGYVGSRVVTEAGRAGVAVVSRTGDDRRGMPSLAWQEFLVHVTSSRQCSVVWLLDGARHTEPQRLDELLAVAPPDAHVVFVSTCTVYGARQDDLCGEDQPLDLLTTDARLKAGCEQRLITSGRSWCVLRLGALYGIDDRGVRKDRIEKWVTQAAQGTVTDECAAALRADRLDGHPGDVLRDAAHAAEADIHRWCAGVQERHQLVR